MSGKKVILIAEAGVNHNGDFSRAIELIDAAAECGADYIKFQTFKAKNIAINSASLAVYQRQNVSEPNQQSMLEKLELDYSWHQKLIDHASLRSIKFMTSPFDVCSAKFVASLDLETIKIPSGEITNLPLLRFLGGLNKKIIMSTGMATVGEIDNALRVLYVGGASKENITVLQCTTDYPAHLRDVNLRAMKTLQLCFDVSVGYSDHTEGIAVAIAATALGASVIEKHLTLDRSLPGPDHCASIEPNDFAQLVKSVRQVELALGAATKVPSKAELDNRSVVRKSLVAKMDINKGDVFTLKNLTVKRPGKGISPMLIDELLGKKAIKKFNRDDLIEW